MEANVKLQSKKRPEQTRMVTRVAANVLIHSGAWKEVTETGAPVKKTSTTTKKNAVDGKAPMTASKGAPAPEAGNGPGPEDGDILKGLRDQYKELSGKNADGRWNEQALMEKIQKLLETAGTADQTGAGEGAAQANAEQKGDQANG